MKRNLLILSILLYSSCLINGQEKDTVFISDKNTTYLVLKNKVQLFDIGVTSSNQRLEKRSLEDGSQVIITDDYAVKSLEDIIFLKAEKENSAKVSLFVKTPDEIYYFPIKYKKEPHSFYYNFKQEKEQSNEKEFFAEINDNPDSINTRKVKEMIKYDPQRVGERLKNVLSSKGECTWNGVKKNGISVGITKIANDRTHYYLKLLIANNTTVDYRVETINFLYVKITRTGILARKNEFTTDLVPTIKPEKILIQGKSSQYYGYAIPMFALDKKGMLQIKLSEVNGIRDVILRVGSKYFNNSQRLE